ncbi:MAG: hypothetical protein ACAI25_04185 [Planctomycetota bacterium]
MPADQDTVKLEALVDLLISKDLISREEFTNALYKKLGIPVVGAKSDKKK